MSKSIGTLQALLERDVEANTVRKAGSHSRNLLRVKRGLDMVRLLFEQILVTEYVYHQLLYVAFCCILVAFQHVIAACSWQFLTSTECSWMHVLSWVVENGNKSEITLKRELGLALLRYDPYNAINTEKKKLSHFLFAKENMLVQCINQMIFFLIGINSIKPLLIFIRSNIIEPFLFYT